MSASCVAVQAGPYANLLEFLVARFPHVVNAVWTQRLLSGKVFDEAGEPISLESALQAPFSGRGKIFYFREVTSEIPIQASESVVYQDERLLVIDKPAGLPVVPSGPYLRETVLVRQKQRLGIDTLVPIHRIDRDTRGLVMFCLQAAHRPAYSALFVNRQVSKVYEALAPHREDLIFPMIRRTRIGPGRHFMLQEELEGQPNAQTEIELIEQRNKLARYRLQPLTGRRHQLRVHMTALGIPILNDSLYPTLTPAGTQRHPLQLLAKSLSFRDPVTNQLLQFKSRQQLMSLEEAIAQQSAGPTDTVLG